MRTHVGTEHFSGGLWTETVAVRGSFRARVSPGWMICGNCGKVRRVMLVKISVAGDLSLRKTLSTQACLILRACAQAVLQYDLCNGNIEWDPVGADPLALIGADGAMWRFRVDEVHANGNTCSGRVVGEFLPTGGI